MTRTPMEMSAYRMAARNWLRRVNDIVAENYGIGPGERRWFQIQWPGLGVDRFLKKRRLQPLASP